MNIKNNGFTIMQVVVAAGLIAIVSVAAMSMMTGLMQSQKGVQNAVDFDTLKMSVQRVLERKALCDIAFYDQADTAVAAFNPAGAVPSARALGTLRMGTTKIAQVGSDLGGGLRVDAITLRQVPGTPTSTVAGKIFVDVELILQLKKTTAKMGGDTLSNAANPFRFGLAVDAVNYTIQECNPLMPVGGPGLGIVDAGLITTGPTTPVTMTSAIAATSAPTAQSFNVNDPNWKKVELRGVTITGTPTPVSVVIAKTPDGQIRVNSTMHTGITQSETISSTSPHTCVGYDGAATYACVQLKPNGKLDVKTSTIADTYEVTK